jgi:hypothetical protein
MKYERPQDRLWSPAFDDQNTAIFFNRQATNQFF